MVGGKHHMVLLRAMCVCLFPIRRMQYVCLSLVKAVSVNLVHISLVSFLTSPSTSLSELLFYLN